MINTYYEATGEVIIEIDGASVELSRAEAEDLFVMPGYTLQDMDVVAESNNPDLGEQP